MAKCGPFYKNEFPHNENVPALTKTQQKDYQSLMEERIVDPKTGGEKGSKPERHDLVPVHPRDEEARVYGFGALKYAPNNWRKGYAWGLSMAALLRHVFAFWRGESHDPESGLHHLAHAKFHCNTLMEFDRCELGTDDRVRD